MSDYFLPPDLYHAVHGSKDDDISFIMEWVKRVGGPVLELGAGTGRLAVPIVEDGFSYTGLDLDPAYVPGRETNCPATVHGVGWWWGHA